MNKETVNRIRRTFISPGMLIGIGVAAFTGSLVDIAISDDNINKKVEQKFPHTASLTEIRQATNEILVFDEKVHDLLISGGTDMSSISNYSGAKRNMELIDQNREIDRQRHELRTDLSDKSKSGRRVLSLGTVGTGLVATGCSIIMNNGRKERKKENKA